MSNKNIRNVQKNKKTKLESSSTTKWNVQQNKFNSPELYCNNCGVILDNIKNFHYIFSDDFGDIDVCIDCLEYLTTGNTNNQPSISPTGNDINQPVSNIPKINLVFLNTPTKDNTDNNITAPSKKDKDKIKDKVKKDGKDIKDTKDNKNNKDKYFGSPSSVEGCTSAGCNDNHDDSGLLFFQQLLNRLHNLDGTSGKTSNLQDEGADTDTEDEDTPLEFEWVGNNIKTIDDLITLGKSYDSRKRKRYNLNLKQLNKLVAPLEELQAMVGMSDVKKIIFDQLIYYLQNLDDKNVDMLHTVIVGPPGVGKTQLTHIIAKIYNRLGFLKTDKVICAKRDDLIGEYIGQTAPKTRKVLERALGGVLLLDEIYSIAPTSDRDFAREAIDMINMYLSEHAHDLVCVVAGYKKPTYEKFFSQNEGLARRFTHHFEIKGYTHDELALIFKKYLEGQKWLLAATLEEVGEIIKGHMEIFPNFGGDMTTLFACCKKAHSRRLLAISTEVELDATKKKIQKPDILEAVGIYKEIKEKHSSGDIEDKAKYMHMYV